MGPTFSLLVRPPNHRHFLEGEGGFAIQDLGYKLIWNSARWVGDLRIQSWEELYDLTTDIEENVNMLDNAPPALSDLRRRLTSWRSQMSNNGIQPSKETMEMLKSLGYIK